jgi:hypothetical protein
VAAWENAFRVFLDSDRLSHPELFFVRTVFIDMSRLLKSWAR